MKCYVTDGMRYVKFDDGQPVFCDMEADAHRFKNPVRAWNLVSQHKIKLEGFYVTDLTGIPVDSPDTSGNGSSRRKYSDTEKRTVYERYHGRCVYCGELVRISYMSIDHKVPLSKGGTNTLGNLQLTCRTCNRIKADVPPEEFLEKIWKILVYNYNGFLMPISRQKY